VVRRRAARKRVPTTGNTSPRGLSCCTERCPRGSAGGRAEKDLPSRHLAARPTQWKAANSFFYPGDPAARAWVKQQTATILAGRHRDVRAGIRRRATTYGYSPAERAGADECAAYLENKQDYLDYPTFLAAGWPVASGLIEGAARWLIKDRMEVTGARWGLDSAEAILRLRALRGNGDLDDYLGYHFQQEKHRNHDSRYQQTYDLAA
jgi:hypothetical protein